MKTWFFLCVLIMVCSFATGAYAQTDPSFSTPAKHLIIMDAQSGEILFEKNARIPMAPASMTKIMTASVVFDKIQSGALSLDDEFVVSENAWRKGGAKSGSSTMFLKPKSKVKVSDLLRGVIIQSGNDACITLAEGIAGSESAFSELMNEKAAQLGLTSAHFKNATGWPDDGHVISAYDLARLALHSIKSYPELYKIYAQPSFTWNGIKQANRNPLILAGVLGADGLKTGHTQISKYGFVGSAVQNGQRRIFVVNGLESKSQRRSESLRIMKSSFSQFSVYNIYKTSAVAGYAKVFMGKSETVNLSVKEDVNIGLAKHLRKNLNVQIKYKSPIPAPIVKGDHIADLHISANGKPLKTIPLYADEEVKRKSFSGRLLASIILRIRGE
ncbi:MAG: D-alanyl-D-alanine carboxypeptidase [Robiginitomaculum sp.]|nr:D-alanyl-D-alanine carboxypeptidase [Robiginitomaculum sp.]